MKPLRKYLTGRRGQGGGEAAKGVGLEGPITGQSTVLSLFYQHLVQYKAISRRQGAFIPILKPPTSHRKHNI